MKLLNVGICVLQLSDIAHPLSWMGARSRLHVSAGHSMTKKNEDHLNSKLVILHCSRNNFLHLYERIEVFNGGILNFVTRMRL